MALPLCGAMGQSSQPARSSPGRPKEMEPRPYFPRMASMVRSSFSCFSCCRVTTGASNRSSCWKESALSVIYRAVTVSIRTGSGAFHSRRVSSMLQYTATVGTAKNGYVAGYRVAGKTGTSEKIDEWNAQGRKGEKRYIASYCGYAPADDPEIVMLVFFDEPLSQEGQVFGSAIAGPVFAEVKSQALPYLGVEPQYTEEELTKLDAKTPSVTGDTVYGRAKVVTDRDDTTGKETQSISIETKQKTYGPIKSGNNVSSGAWVAVRFNKGETGFTSFATMTRLGNVPASAWVGKTAVTYGSRTYEVPSNVQCYNADTDTWMTDLDAARDYGGTMNLYVYDGIVRAVEVKG